MTPPDARAADRIRKGVAYVAAGVGTVWLLRVLFRVAHGRFALGDGELWAFLLLLAVMVLWVRAARPVRRTGEAAAESARGADGPPPPASPGGGGPPPG